MGLKKSVTHNSGQPEEWPVNLYIDGNGDWFNNGIKVVHERIFRLFNESLRMDSHGAYYLKINEQTCPVKVEDTPYVVRGVFMENDARGRDTMWLLLNDGRRVPLEPETLHGLTDKSVRCRVSGRFPAAFSPAAFTQFGQYLERDSDTGGYCLELNGKKYSL